MPALRITRPISAPPREVVRRLGNHFEEHEFVHLDEVDEHGFSLVLRPSATEPAMIATAVVRDEGTGSLLVIEHRGSHVSCLKVSAQILVATIMLAGCMLPEAPRGSLLLALGILGVSWQGSRRARQDRATREFMAIVGAVDEALAASAASPYR
jgi:hypothetical protein